MSVCNVQEELHDDKMYVLKKNCVSQRNSDGNFLPVVLIEPDIQSFYYTKYRVVFF